jgi:hypothetical protein
VTVKHIVAAAILTLDAFGQVWMIGVKRRPKTRVDAILSIAIDVGLIWVVLT